MPSTALLCLTKLTDEGSLTDEGCCSHHGLSQGHAYRRSFALLYWMRTRTSTADRNMLVVTWIAVCQDRSISYDAEQDPRESHMIQQSAAMTRCSPGSSPNLPTSPSKYMSIGLLLTIYRAYLKILEHGSFCSDKRETAFASNCSFVPSHIRKQTLRNWVLAHQSLCTHTTTTVCMYSWPAARAGCFEGAISR